MMIIAVQTRTKDWKALTQTLRTACAAQPPCGVTRCGLYRNAHNAAKAWLLIECRDSMTVEALEPWLEALVADLGDPDAEQTVLERMEIFKS
jgi:hypothetical protein